MPRTRSLSRRQFIAGTVAATASGPLIPMSAAAQDQQAAPALTRKLKLGVVGLGGRGGWIAGLFRRHGGYDMHAVADYFPQVAEEQGAGLGVDPARRFSGLSGYKRLIESGIEAIALEDLPYFFPEQVGAAVDAGLHVYMSDALDTICTMFTFEDGMVWNHQSPKGHSELWFSSNGSLAAEIQGSDASARLSYWGKAYVRGGRQHVPGGAVENLYEAGAVRNIATFYEAVTGGHTENESVQPAVDSALVSILGREAAARRTTVTMADILKENRRLEVDLEGLQA
jgi:predicted dehydrogenase